MSYLPSIRLGRKGGFTPALPLRREERCWDVIHYVLTSFPLIKIKSNGELKERFSKLIKEPM